LKDLKKSVPLPATTPTPALRSAPNANANTLSPRPSAAHGHVPTANNTPARRASQSAAGGVVQRRASGSSEVSRDSCQLHQAVGSFFSFEGRKALAQPLLDSRPKIKEDTVHHARLYDSKGRKSSERIWTHASVLLTGVFSFSPRSTSTSLLLSIYTIQYLIRILYCTFLLYLLLTFT
jgi:hypothetical protein